MKDIATAANELGISPQALNARIRALGIKPTEVREEGKAGKPKRCLSSEQFQEVANYGKKPQEADYGDHYDAVESGHLALQTGLQAPLAMEFQALNMQLEQVEEMASNALVRRIQAVPSRVLAKTAAKLQGAELFPLAEVFRGLSAPSLPVTTIEVNLGSPIARQDSLKPAS